jgi:hypothetical protein
MGCPVTALRLWLEGAVLTEGAAFRSTSRWGHIHPAGLHAASVNEIWGPLLRKQGSSMPFRCKATVLRRGMATSARRAGAKFQDIKKQGGWRHDGTVHGYI